MVNAADLKSAAAKAACGFKPRPRHCEIVGEFRPGKNLPASPFGTFAVLPDHVALGTQAANLIFDLADNDWRAEDHPIELPLSTVRVLDVRSARAFGLRDDALIQVDRPLE